jgi:hypothetical protein
MRDALADLRVLSRDGFVRGSWLVGAFLLGLGLNTATVFSGFAVLAGTQLPNGFYTRQAVGLVLLVLSFPFVILGATLGGGDFARGTYQNRLVVSDRVRLGASRQLSLAGVCTVTVAVVVSVGSAVDAAHPESQMLDLAALVALTGSVSLIAVLWGTAALVVALLSRSVLTGLLVTWGIIAAEVLATLSDKASSAADFLPLHVGLSLLNALTTAPPEEVVNLHPPDLLDPLTALIVAAIWIGTLSAVHLATMSRREF